MKAQVGDRVVTEGVPSIPLGLGRIIELPHQAGEPPFRVRWEDGHESLWFPGPDS